MAADDERRVGTAVDVHFAADLAAEDGVGIAVDEFEGVNFGGAFVADFVDGAAVAVAEDLKLFEVVGGDVGGGGGGGRREREREARAALGGFRQGEAEVELPAIADESHY